MKPDLSRPRRRVLAAVRALERRHPGGVTLEEIRARVGLGSRAAVLYHVQPLIEAGHLRRTPGRHGSIRSAAP